MKAVIILNDNPRFSKGDVVAWGNVNYDADIYSNAKVDPDNPNSELLYGPCGIIEFNPSERPVVQIGIPPNSEYVNVDFKQAHKWNFETEKLELKNDIVSQDLIIANNKFYAIEKIKFHEKKIKKNKTKEKDDIKAKQRNGTISQVLNEINYIVDTVLKDTKIISKVDL